MTTIEINRLKRKIVSVLRRHAGVSPSRSRGLLRIKDLKGKLYEAEVLSIVIENLVNSEGLQIVLRGSSRIELKVSGGPIDRSFPYFQVYKDGRLFGEIFTDTYFSTLSSLATLPRPEIRGDYHELDILVLQPGVSNGHRPDPDEIMIAIECKNTFLHKSIIREALGVRRELSMLANSQFTGFGHWPCQTTNALPPSIHMLYVKNTRRVPDFEQNLKVYGIILVST